MVAAWSLLPAASPPSTDTRVTSAPASSIEECLAYNPIQAIGPVRNFLQDHQQCSGGSMLPSIECLELQQAFSSSIEQVITKTILPNTPTRQSLRPTPALQFFSAHHQACSNAKTNSWMIIEHAYGLKVLPNRQSGMSLSDAVIMRVKALTRRPPNSKETEVAEPHTSDDTSDNEEPHYMAFTNSGLDTNGNPAHFNHLCCQDVITHFLFDGQKVYKPVYKDILASLKATELDSYRTEILKEQYWEWWDYGIELYNVLPHQTSQTSTGRCFTFAKTFGPQHAGPSTHCSVPQPDSFRLFANVSAQDDADDYDWIQDSPPMFRQQHDYSNYLSTLPSSTYSWWTPRTSHKIAGVQMDS
ncbi:hypothetical protein BDZ97DRAFT_1921040 [Flammula alnicola]|nr:hypothetical protein BDZ97DRAFT_1921040 [Flammula alnicola]